VGNETSLDDGVISIETSLYETTWGAMTAGVRTVICPAPAAQTPHMIASLDWIGCEWKSGSAANVATKRMRPMNLSRCIERLSLHAKIGRSGEIPVPPRAGAHLEFRFALAVSLTQQEKKPHG
jgi:hypothetical protein